MGDELWFTGMSDELAEELNTELKAIVHSGIENTATAERFMFLLEMLERHGKATLYV